MTVLQTLPRLRSNSLSQTMIASVPVRVGVTPHTRALAARQLEHALARGHITPGQARAAIKEGDVAVSDLLRPFAAPLALPALSTPALADLPTGGGLSAAQTEQLLGLVHEFVNDGDASVQEVADIANGVCDIVRLVELVQRAWERRCERLTASVLRERPKDAYRCYSIMITPVMEAIHSLSNGTPTALDMIEPGERTSPGVLVELTDWPHVYLPAHPVKEPGFFRAFQGAWKAIEEACGAACFMTGIDKHLSYLAGGIAEAFEDAMMTATWRRGVPKLTSDARQNLQHEFGVENPDDLSPELAAYKAWYEGFDQQTWSPLTREFHDFAHGESTPAQRGLLMKLCNLHAAAVGFHGGSKALRNVQHAYAGDGMFHAGLIPRDYGLDDWIAPWIENLYEGGDPPVALVSAKKKQNPKQFLAMADAVTVNLVIATACLNEVGDYVHAKKRRDAAA